MSSICSGNFSFLCSGYAPYFIILFITIFEFFWLKSLSVYYQSQVEKKTGNKTTAQNKRQSWDASIGTFSMLAVIVASGWGISTSNYVQSKNDKELELLNLCQGQLVEDHRYGWKKGIVLSPECDRP